MGRLCVRVVAIAFAFCLPSLAIAGNAVLIEFSSSRCLPCQQMQPVLSELSQSGVAIRTVDVTREPELTQRYGVQQTPTFVVISGGKELTRLVGKQTADQLRTALAINPSGPWTDTASKPADVAPRTRLAPLPTSLVPPAATTSPASPASLQGEPMPSLSLADAIQRAQAATVRLRVFDGNGFGAGTGTIIDVHGEEALVLTCGHLFRDTKGQGRIEVDLFVSGETKTVEAQLIDYDADVRDIALVAIRPGFAVQPVKIVGTDKLPVSGEAAFSFGCDRGADPTRRDTRVTGVNKYNQDKGASNLEIAGAPIDGRSGGGLFNSQGQLIGVCNAADYEGDVGIYTGPGSVHWQLDRVQLSKLYQPGNGDAAQPTPSQNIAAPASLPDSMLAGNQAIAMTEESRPERFASLGGPLSSATAAGGSLSLSDESEVIVIVRDKANPTAATRVMTLAQPSPELMHMLESQAAR
ncbi:MAG: trypsin-like peptidase domain-containing protein [Planctomycetaceae bacterium]